MKKINFLFCLMLLSSFSFSQWTAQTSGTTNILYTINFVNQTNAYVGGAGNAFLLTTNGGNNWESHTTPTPCTIKSMTITDNNTLFAIGSNSNNGVILKSTNIGSNWSVLIMTPYLWSVNFPDDTTGYIVGGVYPQTGYLLKTTNGGLNWATLINNAPDWLTIILFTDKNTGYMGGGSGILMKTTNGGTSWLTQSSGITNTITSIYFVDNNTGFAVGYLGKIIKTTNAGLNWIEQTSGTTNGFESVYFINQDKGFVVGENGTILETTNAGNNWTPQVSGTNSFLHSVYFTDDSTGYVVGNNGIILKTINGGATFTNEYTLPESSFTLYPNPANHKITLVNNLSLQKESVMHIYDIHGKLLISRTLNNKNSQEIDISSFSKGVYLVKILTEEGMVVKKLVIQ